MNFERIKKIQEQLKYKNLNIKPGYFLEIHEQIGQGDNKRTWKFKCLVIKVKKPNSHTGTFTVRGKSSGIVIEKIYPLSYSNFEKVLLLDEYKIRRAKLYYIREKVGKDAKFKSIIDSANKGKDLLDDIREKEEEKTEDKVEEKKEEEKVEEKAEEKKEEEKTEDKVEDKKEEEKVEKVEKVEEKKEQKTKDKETDVSIDDIPEKVKESLEKELPGAKIIDAEMENEDGIDQYELTVEHDNKIYEIEITPEGKVIEVEEEKKEDKSE